MSSKIVLSAGQSARVLEKARRRRATLFIQPNGREVSCTAKIESVRREGINVAITDSANMENAPDLGSECVVELTVGSDRFVFKSLVREAHGATNLLLDQPERIWVHQRRRFWRAALRESTTVSIVTDPSGTPFEGHVLNVSPEGLACIVDRQAADVLTVGQKVIAQFRLEADDDHFSIVAEVKGSTPAASDSQTILRVQFVQETLSDRDRERIGRAIRTPEPA